jgi:hypothetical protein
MQNQIPIRQDEEAQLKLLRARTQTYAVATRLMILQLCLTALIPVMGALWGIAQPQVRPYFTLLALMVLLFDPLWIDRHYKATLKLAAKISEQFDCTVLELEWNCFAVGERAEVEDIHRAARKYQSGNDDSQLLGWYPKAVGSVPLHMARFICQRTNLRYDSELRRRYAHILAGLTVVVVATVVVLGFVQLLTLQEWVLNIALLSPLLSWSIREFHRQRDTATRLQDLMKSATALWKRFLREEGIEGEASVKAREFQDAIFSHRTSSPLIIPVIYKFLRPGLEDEMNEAASNFLDQYQNGTAGQG